MARLQYERGEDGGDARGTVAPHTLFELGLMYAAGRDVEQDVVEAHKWFNLAALSGHDRARVYRMEIADEMSRVEIIKAQRAARNWLNRD